MNEAFYFGDWRAWAEEKKPYTVHLMKGDDELTFSANEIDRIIEILSRVGNSFYLPSAQVRSAAEEEKQ